MEGGQVSVDGASGGEAGAAPKFVEFSREDSRGRREEPMFTLQASGLLSFNQAAFAVLGEPAAVALLYDADQGIVGVRKVEKDYPNAYPVRRQGRSQTYLVSAQRFTAHYEIPTVAARRFLARDYGDGRWGFALREGDAVKNRRGARDQPAITGRWRHTTSGFDVPAMMNMTSMVMPDPSPRVRAEHDRPPTMRIGTVVACAPLGSTPPTSELRSGFVGFLSSAPVWDLVSALSVVPKGWEWKQLAGRGRINLQAALMGDGQDETQVATAFLLLPDPGLSSYGGRDSRYAQLVVEIELRDAQGRPAPAMTLPVLHDRLTRALAVPAALAVFLTDVLGLATSDDPPAQVGLVLKTPRAMTEIVDPGDLEPLPGSPQSNVFMGWAIADPAGQSAAVTAVELLREMCDYTLSFDKYERVLEALNV